MTSNRGGQRYLPYVFTEQGIVKINSYLFDEIFEKIKILNKLLEPPKKAKRKMGFSNFLSSRRYIVNISEILR